MADPKWKSGVLPALTDVVTLMGGFSSGSFADELLSKDLLTLEQYEEIQKEKQTKVGAEIARKILLILVKLPVNSYKTFCDVLEKTEGGKAVLDRLSLSSVTQADSAASTGAAHRAQRDPDYNEPDGRTPVAAANSRAVAQSSPGDSEHNRGFPRDDDVVTKDLIRAVSSAGADQWAKICSFLLSAQAAQEIKGLSDDSTVRLMNGIERWKKESPEIPTVRKLIKVCKESGVSRRFIMQMYDNLFTSD